MVGTITVNEENCVGCNKCIRNCVAFEANVSYVTETGNKVKVDTEKCILCGKCIEVCDHDARDFSDDTELFFNDLEKGKKISVIAAPSVRVNFLNYEKLFGFLKAKGVNIIYDVSFGADITTWAYLKAIKENHLESVIAQPCPAIVAYIEKYENELIKNLAPIHSPMMCTAVYLKRYENHTESLAFLSPCIAKTNEINDSNTGNMIEYNVTFKKISEYIENHNIKLNDYPSQPFEDIGSSLGCLFSRPGGLRENVEQKVKGAWIRQIEGHEYAYKYLDEYSRRVKFNKSVPLLVDILNCPHGCSIGTATTKEVEVDDVDEILNSLKVEKLSDKGGKLITRKIDWLYKQFDQTLKLEDFMRRYNTNALVSELREPSESEYDGVFNQMFKKTSRERQVNCSACGYDNCRDMVKAVLNDLNTISNCMDYNRHEATFEKTNFESKNMELEEKNIEINRVLEEVNKMSEERHTKAIELEEVINKIAVASKMTSRGVEEVTELVAQIASGTDNVSNFAGDVFASVNSVVLAMKEINISLNEISTNCGRSKNITADAEEKARSTNEIIEKLNISSKQIGKIVKVINEIADQTNMLALNAAIEAAGAGEAGKGFAVVAGEVKALARQTAESTEEIGQQIEAMQTNMSSAVDAMGTISQVIDEMSSITNTIAAAVAEQSAVSGGISEAVIDAASKVNLITEKTSYIAKNSHNAAQSVAEASNGIKGLAETASILSNL